MMWKKETEAVTAVVPSVPATRITRERSATSPPSLTPTPATLGKSLVIKGELRGAEDFQVDGVIEGSIDLRDHVLTVGASGTVKADIKAKSVIVLGTVRGNVRATERIELREKGSIDGDIVAPRVAMAEGSHFRGSIDMNGASASASTAVASVKPEKHAHSTSRQAAVAG